jgi:glycerol-3-phosphate acyltransferase PlsY
MSIFILILIWLAIVLTGYLIGSISWAVIISYAMYKIDIYKVGSGNAGGTNVGRAAGKKGAVLVIILDALKCLLVFWAWFFIITLSPLGSYIEQLAPGIQLGFLYYSAGLGAAIGHIFPLYYHFKGGKAVSCFAGFMLGTNWLLCLIGTACFFGVFFWKKRVSLSSITGTILVFVCALVFGILGTFYPDLFAFSFWFFPGPKMDQTWVYSLFVGLYAILVIILHRANIKRLAQRKEPETHFLHKGEKPVANYESKETKNKGDKA